jgi:hypothetical protein
MKHVIVIVMLAVVMGISIGLTAMITHVFPVASASPNDLPFLTVTEGPVEIGWTDFRMLSNRVTGEEYLFLSHSSGAIFLVPVSRAGLTNGK